MNAVEELRPLVGMRESCRFVGLSRSTLHRRHNPPSVTTARTRAAPAFSLSDEEQQRFLDLAHSSEFIDKTPVEIFYSLLDAKTYICSIRTMYRILAEQKEVQERRDQRRRPFYKRPELMATGPNQLWSWDITKLRGPTKGYYYYLYVLLDVYSRLVVSWLLGRCESEQLARTLLQEGYSKQCIKPGQLTIHSDNGPAMKAKAVGYLLSKLDVERSFSRPYVSDDNPYSESHFKTLKYRPDYPERFGSFEDALTLNQGFMPWYNDKHYHSGICWLTPADVHYGHAERILRERHQSLLLAYEETPRRFMNGPPKLQVLPAAVWINAPTKVSPTNPTPV